MNYLALDPAGMVTFLTDISDRKAYKYRLKNEEHLLLNPYIVMLSCTVPEWLTRQIRADEFCSGFGRRTIFVCDDSDIRMKPVLSAESKAAYERCVKRLKEIPSIVGEYKLSQAANDWFWKEWYPHYKLPDDKFLRGWGRSKHIQMFKVAMLTALSEGNDMVITKNLLEYALALLQHIEEQIPMITSRMGRSDVVEPAMNLLATLNHHDGWMFLKELKMSTITTFRNPTEQWQTIEYLKSTDQVVVFEKDDNGTKRQVIALAKVVMKKVTGIEAETKQNKLT